jgi:hypothetical protein
METQVFLFDVDGHEALGFDTGLDSRAFARAKFAQFITEPGLIVNLDGPAPSAGFWKASGVVESPDVEGQPAAAMVVWGPPFRGERLDLLLQDSDKRDEALTAISRWIQAVLALGEKHHAPLWPCAALIGGIRSSEIFFAPPGLALHCLMTKESNQINCRYVHPDLKGMNAAAFTAAAMLYRIFAGSPAFPAEDEIILHEDMREGNFLPIRLAAPGLDDRLAALIQNALNQGGKKSGELPNGARLLEGFLAIMQPAELPALAGTVSPVSFFGSLPEADRLSIEKEKTQYLKTKTASVKARRFVMRNAALLIGCFAAVVIAALITNSVIKSRSALTTAGMEPLQVIESYYNAFGKLDHLWMEACVIKGAGKDDINMVMNFFVFDKVRQAYEMNVRSSFISAKDWLETGGGQVNFQVFGVADLQINSAGSVSSGSAGGGGDNGEQQYRADYTLWVPGETGDEDFETEHNANGRAAEYLPPKSFHRTDIVTLVQRKGNWRISDIKRVSED